MNGAELLVSALENQGVRQICGVPGEGKPDVAEPAPEDPANTCFVVHDPAHI